MILPQARLRIERVHLRYSTVHEQEDDGFRLGRIMRLLWFERILGCGCLLIGEQIRQREPAESIARNGTASRVASGYWT